MSVSATLPLLRTPIFQRTSCDLELPLEIDGTDGRLTISENLIPPSSPETAQGAKSLGPMAPTAWPSPKTQRTSGAKIQNLNYCCPRPSSPLLSTARIAKTATGGDSKFIKSSPHSCTTKKEVVGADSSLEASLYDGQILLRLGFGSGVAAQGTGSWLAADSGLGLARVLRPTRERAVGWWLLIIVDSHR